MQLPYLNRMQAGQALAAQLSKDARGGNTLVLALPRGGVPVAEVIASTLDAPMDVLIVRKLGLPGQEELAIGAIASGGAIVLNHEIIQSLALSEHIINDVVQRERRELTRRESFFRGEDREPLDVAGRRVILVDDGLATGATMRAAIAALRSRKPQAIIVAVPVAPADTVETLRPLVDEIVCPATPEPFGGVGRWYEDFSQVDDETVRAILKRNHHGQSSRSSRGIN